MGIIQLEERRVLSATATVMLVDPGGDSAETVTAADPLAAQDWIRGRDDTSAELGALALASSHSVAAPPAQLVGGVYPSIDLNAWSGETSTAGSGTPQTDKWQVSEDGKSVQQEKHTDPSVFYSDFELDGQALEFNVQVLTTSDDDFIGFVVGYTPGDFSSADADYLLMDWKQRGQTYGATFGQTGLAVSRVSGVPDHWRELWGHDGHVEELARAQTLGDTGWQDFVEHRFSIQYSTERLFVFVDGQLEFDIEAPGSDPFPAGRIGFYVCSQKSVEFSIPTVEEIQGMEGTPVAIVEELSHQGLPDQFGAEIDWGDGIITAATISDVNGIDLVTGEHVYADNGTYPIAMRLVDGDRSAAIGRFEAEIANVSPSLAIDDRTVGEGGLVSFAGLKMLTDPGFDNPALGTHETFGYAIDWGDGMPNQTGEITVDTVGSAGVPTVGHLDGSHRFADNGQYSVAVSVTDDDGGTATTSFQVTVTNVEPTLAVVEDQTITEGGLLWLVDLGLVTDPGFDAPLLGTDETFGYTINWGDGSQSDSGSVTIDTAGSAGAYTNGSFDGSHTFVDHGQYTVMVTVVDDDGGRATASFEVDVERREISVVREGSGDYIYAPRQTAPPVLSRPVRAYDSMADRTPPTFFLRSVDSHLSGLDSDAATEDYVVLRRVMADGREGPSYRLPDDALENLPEILRRLPDDRYRIYQVRSNGLDRLIRDFYVRRGVVIDHGDISEGIFDRPPQSQLPSQPGAKPDDSRVFPDGAEPGGRSPLVAIDEAWAGWDQTEHRCNSSSIESPGRGTNASSEGDAEATGPSGARSDSALPEGLTQDGSVQEAAIGVSAALLSFRLRAGWHQELDAAMSQFRGSTAGRRQGGHRPGQPR